MENQELCTMRDPRIHIISDLHVSNWGHFAIPEAVIAESDFIVIAGDVDNGVARSDEVIRDICSMVTAINLDCMVLAVAGNHEYYQETIDFNPLNVIGLDNYHLITATTPYWCDKFNVAFVGDTLWTDYKMNGRKNIAMSLAQSYMPDHNVITDFTDDQFRFTPDRALSLHVKQKKLIGKDILYAYEKGYKVVLVTHHGISGKSVAEKFKVGSESLLNGAFVSELSNWDALAMVSLAVHGHVHNNVDYWIGGTRVITNPRGYINSDGVPENLDFDPYLIVTLHPSATCQ